MEKSEFQFNQNANKIQLKGKKTFPCAKSGRNKKDSAKSLFYLLPFTAERSCHVTCAGALH